MQTDTRAANPILLVPNPVWRSYGGGKVLRRFRGLDGTDDDHFPEDWLASTVRARNGKNATHADEGLSMTGESVGGAIYLSELIEEAPEFWFGEKEAHRRDTGVLWKLLDASGRLQFQAHPDVTYAQQHLNSNAGKTECWYIIGTREEACVYLGFQRPPSREAWGRMIKEQRIDEMMACFDEIKVRAGDCYVVPAGVPHAIGAGVFMMELMEPTDWAVRCERVNAGVTLPPEACFMGLDLETCLDVFNYQSYSVEDVRRTFQQKPRALRTSPAFVEEAMIGPKWHSFFRLNRLRGTGTARFLGGELMLMILIKGAGELNDGRGSGRISAGQTWLLPGAAPDWHWQPASADWEFLIAKLPVVTKTRATE